jgi:O-antigen biosynthesis protein
MATEPNGQNPCCELIVPVYNSLSHVRDCLESVLACTDPALASILLVDDGSDATTHRFLADVADQHAHVRLLTNRENLGFLKTCNLGMQAAETEFVLLLNSDTVVVPDWLERLLECARSDPTIAAVNPLTNRAANIDLPMAPGASFLAMDAFIHAHHKPTWPDIVTGVGFCMLLRRQALDEVGLFDEIYDRGYCEESDLCMRLVAAGWRTVIADHVYLYHRGRASFTDREQRYRHNRRLFDQRWSSEYRRQFAQFRKADPMARLHRLFEAPGYWDPKPAAWQAARRLQAALADRNVIELGRAAVGGTLQVIGHRQPVATAQYTERFARPGRLRVTYVLKDLVIAGGVLSVIQLVNELILLGVEARIVTLFEDPLVHDWSRLYTRPLVFRDTQALIEQFPQSDIVVATLWETAPWVAEILRCGKARQAAYFVQDFEPWFFPENEPQKRNEVLDTYGMIEHRIVKSQWLKQHLEKHGFESHQIPLGMDLGRYYPQPVTDGPPTIIAMARPGTSYRGFDTLTEALARVQKARPEVQIILFGARNLRRHALPFRFRDEGVVHDPSHLARLYSGADVFIDTSTFQGFGRCGLEAMACGTACVLSASGGVGEYARDRCNSLLVDPDQTESFIAAVLELLDNQALRANLIEGGLTTVRDYCHKREARDTLSFFQSLVTGA